MPRKSKSSVSTAPGLFAEEQQDMLEKSFQEVLEAQVKQPVECLGIAFPNDAARREHFLGLLAAKLKDHEFRKIEGFPLGTDEDILAISDPPYYTACPNPWVKDFVTYYGTPYDCSKPYQREPFAADVSEGKNHPIYNAHSYHTKVPHRAIMRYILHYTEPGDVLFDGFAGTGMTGVAAQLCGERTEVQALGYRVNEDGIIFDEGGKPFSKIGVRHPILNDISTAASYIAYNYNTPVNAEAFSRVAKRIVQEVEDELGWMFETEHSDGKAKGRINFTVWSDVFVCPECRNEIIFWDSAVNTEEGNVRDEFECSHCKVLLTKRACERAWNTIFDRKLKTTTKQAKQVPVIINYSVSGKRYEKRPDFHDLEVFRKAEEVADKYWFPTERMMEGGETRRNDSDGISHVHHFYSTRNRAVLAAFWYRINKLLRDIPTLGLWFTSSHVWATRQNRLLVSNYFKKKGGVIGQTLQGTLYISSIGIETNAIERFGLRISSVPFTAPAGKSITCTGSTAAILAPDCSVDYLFVDPPFGANIAYSELNFLWESWLKVITNNSSEAIENRPHGKSLLDYHGLIRNCFKECYRILKPGRWITIEFSNTKAAVWNSIQSSLGEVGFVVANVSVLEKEHKGFRAVTTPTAVKQDLVISAYKPNGGLEERFAKAAGQPQGAWEFVRTHLKYLPVVSESAGQLEFIAERDPRIIFDRMVAFYFQHGMDVPLNSAAFQLGLSQLFSERDGMIFLPDQATEHDRKKLLSKGIGQRSLLVDDERSAIDWLTEFLKTRPSESSDIVPQFMEQLRGSTWRKGELRPEIHDLLRLNFLCYDGTGDVPSQIHSYLSSNFKECRSLTKNDRALQMKAKDRWYVPDPNNAIQLEKTRERDLLRDFDTYRMCKDRKIKEFRIEALRVGFKKAWQDKDYQTIIATAAKIPDDVIQEDPKLLMWHSNACTRAGVEA